MTWEIFEREAHRYERWYATPRGRRADRAEGALLAWLLGGFPGARRVLEVGSGTGHFARWLTAQGYLAVELDRSPAMLREAGRHPDGGPRLLADAHELPVRDRAVDVVVLVTTLEFLERPERALRECVRVADRGLVVLALNRWSPGALARRRRSSRSALLSRADDRSLPRLRRELTSAAGARLRGVRWRCTLLPRPLDGLVSAVPFGDVIGMAVALDGAA